MTAAVNNQTARLLLGMTPPSSDHHEAAAAAGGRIRTLLDLLTTEKFDSLDRATRSNGGSRWRNLRQRLGVSMIGCCGAVTWRFGSPPLVDDEDNENGVVLVELQQDDLDEEARDSTVARGMNLAAALAAERQLRPPRTPLRRLLTAEKSELEREKEEREKEDELEVGEAGMVVEESDSVCCVCMGRKKGAAIIPCGHTYCRVCSREIWLTRGSCPLCNRTILEVLDIF